MYINRLIETTILKAAKTFPVVILTGARQSGKTTLLKHLFENTHNYLSLDELDIRSIAANDPRGFLSRYKLPLIIDEIQNVPQLLPYIKAIVDREKIPGLFIITGSQQFSVMKNVNESLARRAAILNLYPFMLEEVTNSFSKSEIEIKKFLENLPFKLNHKNKKINLASWLLNGGYPALFVNKNISRNLWFSSYIQTCIDRDIRGNIKGENIIDFERFLKLLASRTAQELNYSNLSRELGLSVPTIKSWVSLLESNSIVYLLQPYYKNFGKRIIKSPKIYFLDTGLVSFLVSLHSEEHLLNGPMAGSIFETFIISNFLKRFKALDNQCNIYYWKNVSGIEIDLIIEYGNKLYPIEIKLTSTIYSKHYESLSKWINLLSEENIDIALLINDSDLTGKLTDKIFSVNWYNI
ncbi:MAG: ATP-binding protein [Actinobacteria bacterium]|nr:ATP-binding protein [Cyanobacteriota bacterium]MCL5772287.1 ATP-binding protein [Actinomycetota bacterium]